MRELTVHRRRHFAGCLIPYYLVADALPSDFLAWLAAGRAPLAFPGRVAALRSGESATLPLGRNASTLFAAALTSGGFVCSERIALCAGEDDLFFELRTEYSALHGSRYVLAQIFSPSGAGGKERGPWRK